MHGGDGGGGGDCGAGHDHGGDSGFFWGADGGGSNRSGQSSDSGLFVFGLAIGAAITGLVAWFFLSTSPVPVPFHSEQHPASITAADIRATLQGKCVGRPEVLADIETMLPANGRGEITAARLRSVLIEVVGKC